MNFNGYFKKQKDLEISINKIESEINKVDFKINNLLESGYNEDSYIVKEQIEYSDMLDSMLHDLKYSQINERDLKGDI